MPQEFLDQVKWLCKEIPKVEWSGVLFYSIEGSITDPENMVITVEQILPMNKGTAAYTEYTFDDRVLDFMMDTPGADDWKMGHIHSHNTMNVYFSGTDWSELEDNSPNHNFYLSLIVNNFMEFCAKVAFVVKSDKAQFTAKDEHGAKYHYSIEALEQKKMVTYDCKIEVPSREINVEDAFKEKVEGIIKAASKRAVTTHHIHTSTPRTGVTKHTITPRSTSPQHSLVGKSNPGLDAWGQEGWGQGRHWDEPFTPDIQSALEDVEEEMIEDFTKFVLNTGNDISKCQNIDDVLDIYKPFGMTPTALAGGVVKNYLAVYNNYFDKVLLKDTPDMFEQVTNGVIEVLDIELQTTTHKYTMDMIRPVRNALEQMLKKFTQYESDTV